MSLPLGHVKPHPGHNDAISPSRDPDGTPYQIGDPQS